MPAVRKLLVPSSYRWWWRRPRTLPGGREPSMRSGPAHRLGRVRPRRSRCRRSVRIAATPLAARDAPRRWPPGSSPSGWPWTVTGTLYVPDHAPDGLAALDARACTGTRTSGCRHEAPAGGLPRGTFTVTLDTDHDTVLHGTDGALELLDTQRGRTGHVARCSETLETVSLDGTVLREGAIDLSTHTAYFADVVGNRVVAFDTNACHTGHGARCTPVATVGVGPAPTAIAINPRTHTVSDWRSTPAPTRSTWRRPTSSNPPATSPSWISDAATSRTPQDARRRSRRFARGGAAGASSPTRTRTPCSAGTSTKQASHGAICNTGCSQRPARIPVGDVPFDLALDRSTHTRARS